MRRRAKGLLFPLVNIRFSIGRVCCQIIIPKFMISLTKAQQNILDYIRRSIERDGFPPTRAEIAQYLGVRSTNSVVAHLDALVRKGAIELTPRASRGIRLIKNEYDANALRLPLVGHVAAGAPILAREHIEDSYVIDTSGFRILPDFLLKVRGASMSGIGILDGDLLAISKRNYAADDEIVVARIGDEVTVKRFRKIGDEISLLPENRDFLPIVISATSLDFAIEGLLVGLIRKY